jgi:hypothetical protein
VSGGLADYPLRDVVKAELRMSTSLFMEGNSSHYYHRLTLSCGHTEERRPIYRPGLPTGWGRVWRGTSPADVIGHRKRVRCVSCGEAG